MADKDKPLSRRDSVLTRMLKTPPEPRATKVKKPKRVRRGRDLKGVEGR